ncbi:uncharacterized protein LOC143911612 [Arctopsyche grandis]|uniref:uncharacterized protein LOC143911612 n=1 Tax=Arctopsyche grandis TaxID=121162 RepID=UPI00406D8DCD
MWGRCLRLGNVGTKVGRRSWSFLSSKYGCEEAWSKRAVGEESGAGGWAERPDELYSRLEHRAAQQQPISLVDVDLFLRCARADQLGEVRDILHKTRSSALAHLALPSTNYAAVRLFDEAGADALPDLLQMLDDRLNYGLFLDRFTANILFDKMLERRDYSVASKLAGFLMLQENFEGPITEQFALYSAYKFLELPLPAKEPVVEEPTKAPVKKKKVEEIKIRVAFLRNPFFDDHFDLTDDRMIAGKTLAMITSKRDDPTSCDCNLLGWVFYKKFDKAMSAAQRLAKKGEIYKDTLDRLEYVVENYDENDAQGTQMLGDILSIIKNIPVNNKSIEDEITTALKKTIEEHEQNEISEHIQTLKSWDTLRSEKLQEQMQRLEVMKRAAEKASREKIIQEIDEKIWFFDNEEEVDLKIQNKKEVLREEPRIYKKKKAFSKSDTNYIPPEISRR